MAFFGNMLFALTVAAASFLVLHQKDTANDVLKRPNTSQKQTSELISKIQ